MAAQAIGRVLGIDYGTVRIGLAISDPLRLVAQPLAVLRRKSDRQVVGEIVRIVSEQSVQGIVCGLPLHMSGEQGQEADRALAFAELLRQELPDVEVASWDERLTTVQSERVLIDAGMTRVKRKKHIDKVAATILLQNYLDYLHRDSPSA
jgi:putative Holliday junction resolvase